jgi:hypothetical protein
MWWPQPIEVWSAGILGIEIVWMYAAEAPMMEMQLWCLVFNGNDSIVYPVQLGAGRAMGVGYA